MYQIFYFHVYGNMVEENRMYQQLQKICGMNVCRGNVFQIWAKYPLHTPNIACSYSYAQVFVQLSNSFLKHTLGQPWEKIGGTIVRSVSANKIDVMH